MRSWMARSVLAAVVCVSGAAAASGQSGNDLLQQALAAERADGKLGEAIALYQRIVKDHASEHQLAARALVQLGRAYERLGANQARSAYERVVREYADQSAEVAEARRRIVVLDGAGVAQQGGPAADLPSVRQLWRAGAPAFASTVGMSSDGRFASFIDFVKFGNVALRDLTTGETRSLTRDGSDSTYGAPERTVISPDGRQVAYSWSPRRAVYQVRIVATDGTAPRILVRGDTGDLSTLRAYDFTPDGTHLIVGLATGSLRRRLAVVDVQNATARVIADVNDWPSRVRVSPDGRDIVYDAPQDGTLAKRDIVIRPIAGGAERVLVSHPADDRFPMWTPDGKAVFFVSDRGGVSAGWVVRVASGAASGEAVKVLSTVGTAPVGFRRDGSLMYIAGTRKSDVYVGELDLRTGEWVTRPAALRTLAPGNNGVPSWSADGRFIAYAANVDKTLRIHEVATGAEREFAMPFPVGRSSWAPDGRSLVIASVPTARRGAIYRVDVQTGASEKIVDAPTFGWGTAAAFAKDGSAIFYIRGDTTGSGTTARTRIVRRDLRSSAEQVIYTSSAGEMMCDLALSPDGTTLLFAQIGNTTASIGVVSTADSTSARIVRTNVDQRRRFSFTADGSSVLHIISLRTGSAVWSTPIDGSAPRKLAANVDGAWEFVLAPDGRHAALRIDDATTELWIAERFLPARTNAGRQER